jgi:hypothetical protein
MRWLLLTAVLFLGACNTDRIAQLEKQNKEMRAELDRQKTLVDLDTQAKCSNTSRIFFNINFRRDKDTVLLDYSNHYNKKLGKCFILVEWHYNVRPSTTGEWFNVMMLHDVFENNKYAELSEEHLLNINITPVATETRIVRCEVDGQQCKTSDEFGQQTRHYMVD